MERSGRFTSKGFISLALLARGNVQLLDFTTHVRPVIPVSQCRVRLLRTVVAEGVVCKTKEDFTEITNTGYDEARANI